MKFILFVCMLMQFQLSFPRLVMLSNNIRQNLKNFEVIESLHIKSLLFFHINWNQLELKMFHFQTQIRRKIFYGIQDLIVISRFFIHRHLKSAGENASICGAVRLALLPQPIISSESLQLVVFCFRAISLWIQIVKVGFPALNIQSIICLNRLFKNMNFCQPMTMSYLWI